MVGPIKLVLARSACNCHCRGPLLVLGIPGPVAIQRGEDVVKTEGNGNGAVHLAVTVRRVSGFTLLGGEGKRREGFEGKGSGRKTR